MQITLLAIHFLNVSEKVIPSLRLVLDVIGVGNHIVRLTFAVGVGVMALINAGFK